MMLRLAPILCCIAAWTMVVMPVHAEQSDKLGEWKKVQSAGVTIEYQEGMEDLARQLLPEVVKKVRNVPVAGSPENLAQLDDLSNKKDKILNFISAQIGLDKPGTAMEQTFDNTLNGLKQILPSVPIVHQLRLWPKETVKAMLLAGEKMPGWSYDEKTDDINLSLEITAGPDKKTERVAMPIILSKNDPVETSIKNATTNVDDYLIRFSNILYPAESLFHDIAINGIAADIGVKSAFTRWFCEGMANYISELCVKEFPGKYISPNPPVWTSTTKFESIKAQVDLLNWRIPGWEMGPMDENLQNAHLAFSLKEIQGIASRHGAQKIPSIMKEFKKSETRNNQAIFDAIKTATGEDIKPTLEKYGTAAKDEFKGLAVGGFIIGATEIDSANSNQLKVAETTNIPCITDGKHGLAVRFMYETQNPPLEARCEVVNPSGKVLIGEDLKFEQAQEGPIWHPMLTKDFEPGDYTVKVYFSKKLFREVPIKLTAAP